MIKGVLEEMPDGDALHVGGSLTHAATASVALEVKFDVSLDKDKERWIFATSWQSQLAKKLGIATEHINIIDVKPGSPLTIIRFQVHQLVNDGADSTADLGQQKIF